VLKAQNINKLSKRTMYRVGTPFMELGRNQISNIVRASVSHRNYPGEFRAVRYVKEDQPVRGGTGKSLPNHETYHTNLQNAKTKEILGLFTTHPKPNESHYHKVADEKLDGTAGEQFIGAYNNPKIITGDSKLVRELPEAQSFVDKYEEQLRKIKAEKSKAIREDRTTKEDSRFYNENGTKDAENFPIK